MSGVNTRLLYNIDHIKTLFSGIVFSNYIEFKDFERFVDDGIKTCNLQRRNLKYAQRRMNINQTNVSSTT